MIQTFVINLDRDTKRMETLHEHLVQNDMADYERVSAETYKADDMADWMGYMCPKGVAGSAASHRKIWKEIVSRNLDMALILEDDARFIDGACDTLKKVFAELPDDFDILFVGSGGLNSDHIRSPVDLIHFPGMLTPKTGKNVSENLIAPLAPLDIHAYIVSYKGAQKLLEREQKVCFLDADMVITPGLAVYACNPSLAYQAEFESHAKTTFPLVISNTVGDIFGASIKWLEIFNTLPITNWVIIVGTLAAFQPMVLLLIIPDVYSNFSMVVSTLLITLLVRVILSRQ